MMSKIDIESVSDLLLNDRLHAHTTASGLRVYVYEMPGKSSVSAQLAVGFGSTMVHVLDKGSRYRLPAGTAHFLEHKLFERNGVDSFTLFADLGASSNAYTTFNRTTFVFRSGREYGEPLRVLLDFFRKPLFTEEGVEKEKPIIEDEIRMYMDDPGWRASFNLFRNLYRNIGINEDIAGNLRSIRDIDYRLLNDCFDSFYRPRNMALAVAGPVDHEKVFEIAEQLDQSGSEVPRFESASAQEQDGIIRDSSLDRMNLSIPMFDIGFKERGFARFSDIKYELLMDMVLDLISGESTEFFRQMYDSNLLSDSFGSGFYSGNEYLCTYFEGDSHEPEKVRDMILDRIGSLKRSGLDPELFEERARTSVGSYISIFDSPGSVAGSLISCHFKNTSLYDIIQLVGNPDIDAADSMLRDCFDPSQCSLSVITPTESGDR
ncbi:MAG: insulinase family protein [Oscillospiraceae bacterium]|nr:insulinase family protein [Oscillospiraceae bacterium]